MAFPNHKAGFSTDDQYFIGDSGLLVKPITEKDATEASVYLSESRVRRVMFYFILLLSNEFRLLGLL